MTTRTVNVFKYRMISEGVAKTFANVISKGPRLDPKTKEVEREGYRSFGPAPAISEQDTWALDNCNLARLIATEEQARHPQGFNASLKKTASSSEWRSHEDRQVLTGRNDIGPQWCGESDSLLTDGPGLYFKIKPEDVTARSAMAALFSVLENTDANFGGVVIRAVRQTSTHLPVDISGTVLQITAKIFPKSSLVKLLGTRDNVFYQVTHLYMPRNLMEYAFVSPGRLRLDIASLAKKTDSTLLPGTTTYADVSDQPRRGDLIIPPSTMGEFAESTNKGITFYSPILVNGDVVLPSGKPGSGASLARFLKPIEMGMGTLMRPGTNGLAPYVPTKFSDQVRSTVEEVNSFVRGNAGFLMLGARSDALDVNAGIASGTVGTLLRTCLENLTTLDPLVSQNSWLVMKETPSRALSSVTKGDERLSSQSQFFTSAFAGDKTVFIPQSNIVWDKVGGREVPKPPGVIGTDTADMADAEISVVPPLSGERAEDIEVTHPIFDVKIAMRGTYETAPPAGEMVTAKLGYNQQLKVQFSRNGANQKCDATPKNRDKIKSIKEEKKALEENQKEAKSKTDLSRSMAKHLEDTLTKVRQYEAAQNAAATPTPTPTETPSETPTGTSTPTPAPAADNKLLPNILNWYVTHKHDELNGNAKATTARDYINNNITNHFNETESYLKGADYALSSYGCVASNECTDLTSAFAAFFARVHYEVLEEEIKIKDDLIKEESIKAIYRDHPFEITVAVRPHLVDDPKAPGEKDAQPNIAKLEISFSNVESWKHCGYENATFPDVTLTGFELGSDGSGNLSRGRLAHPLNSNQHRLFWTNNVANPGQLDLKDSNYPPNISRDLSASYFTMNPDFIAGSIGTPPDMARNYAAERRICDTTSDHRYGDADPVKDFDKLAKQAWNFSPLSPNPGEDPYVLTIAEPTLINDLVAPLGRADYSWPMRTGLLSIVVKATAAILVGNYVTETLEIEARNTPLIIISTMIVNNFQIDPSALKAGIIWIAPQDEAALKILQRVHAVGRDMDCSVLDTPALAAAPLWHPTLKKLGNTDRDISARMAMSCTLATMAPKLGEAFSSVNGSPPAVPNLTTAATELDLTQMFKGPWMHVAVAADLSNIFH